MTDPADLMASLEQQLKPYRGRFPSFPQLPEDGLARAGRIAMVEHPEVGSSAGAAFFAAPCRAPIDTPGLLPQARPDGGWDKKVVSDR